MADAYFTLSHSSEGFYKEKGSRFLSFAYPVKSESEIKQHLSALSKRYFDAQHCCYAYILGAPESSYRAYDDGEPNHSAGDPILGQLRSQGITNALVAVVRYFGGTKLGVGGLVNAYRTAAALALNANEVKKEFFKETIRFRFNYSDTAMVMRLINQLSLEISEQEFNEVCLISVDCLKKEAHSVFSQLHLIPSVQLISQTMDPNNLDPSA